MSESLARGIGDAGAWILGMYPDAELDPRGEHLLFASIPRGRMPDNRPREPSSIAVTVETAETMVDGTARRRLSVLETWKGRFPNRWVCVFLEAGAPFAGLCGLPHDQVVTWPRPEKRIDNWASVTA